MNQSKEKIRTHQQHKALWVYFTQLAEALNDAGLDQRVVLKPSVAILWDKNSVHKYLWKGIQEVMLGKESTTELTTKEIDKVYDVLNRHLGETTGVTVEFPSQDTRGV